MYILNLFNHIELINYVECVNFWYEIGIKN